MNICRDRTYEIIPPDIRGKPQFYRKKILEIPHFPLRSVERGPDTEGVLRRSFFLNDREPWFLTCTHQDSPVICPVTIQISFIPKTAASRRMMRGWCTRYTINECLPKNERG